MCGRYVNNIPVPDVIYYFGVPKCFSPEKRFNIAPSQKVTIIRQQGQERVLAQIQWGLIPHWAKDPKIGYAMINARAETVATKPSFRDAFRSRRCIVPASGFYEWKRGEKTKQPYYITRVDGAPMAMAGIWERWASPEKPEEIIETFAIITIEATGMVAQLHNRMPVVLEREEIGTWLDPHRGQKELQALLQPAADGLLEMRPVSDYVNKPDHEGAQCIKSLS